MSKIKRSSKELIKNKISPFIDYWENINYIFFLTGIGILILGYFLMTVSPWDNPISLSISPIVLLIGYLIVIPVSILAGTFNKRKDDSSKS